MSRRLVVLRGRGLNVERMRRAAQRGTPDQFIVDAREAAPHPRMQAWMRRWAREHNAEEVDLFTNHDAIPGKVVVTISATRYTRNRSTIQTNGA